LDELDELDELDKIAIDEEADRLDSVLADELADERTSELLDVVMNVLLETLFDKDDTTSVLLVERPVEELEETSLERLLEMLVDTLLEDPLGMLLDPPPEAEADELPAVLVVARLLELLPDASPVVVLDTTSEVILELLLEVLVKIPSTVLPAALLLAGLLLDVEPGVLEELTVLEVVVTLWVVVVDEIAALFVLVTAGGSDVLPLMLVDNPSALVLLALVLVLVETVLLAMAEVLADEVVIVTVLPVLGVTLEGVDCAGSAAVVLEGSLELGVLELVLAPGLEVPTRDEDGVLGTTEVEGVLGLPDEVPNAVASVDSVVAPEEELEIDVLEEGPEDEVTAEELEDPPEEVTESELDDVVSEDRVLEKLRLVVVVEAESELELAVEVTPLSVLDDAVLEIVVLAPTFVLVVEAKFASAVVETPVAPLEEDTTLELTVESAVEGELSVVISELLSLELDRVRLELLLVVLVEVEPTSELAVELVVPASVLEVTVGVEPTPKLELVLTTPPPVLDVASDVRLVLLPRLVSEVE
jgi:hypothetical protein